MAINLLPADEKSKIKKQKPPASIHIELTGPEKAEKKKPGIKKAGVLMFFKTAFQKPKKDVLKEEREKAEKAGRLPEKKVIYREKIIIERPEQKERPKFELHEPAKKPESLKVKPAFKLGERISSFFSGLFKGKPTAPKKVEEKPEVGKKPFIPEEQFPKYKKEKLEEILSKPEGVPRKPEVIELLAKKVEVKKEEPKKKTESAWQRFGSWLKGIFSRKAVKALPKPIPKSLVPKEKISEYKPVKAEKILLSAAAKPRGAEIIKLTTKKKVIEKGEPEKEKKKGRSLWQSFVDWLKGLFGKKSEKEIKPSLPLEESLKPKMPLPEKRIVIQREERVVIPQAKEEPSQAEIEKKIGEPVEPRKKEELFSYATPLPPLKPEEKKTEQEVMPKYEIVKPPTFVAPQKEEIKKFMPPPPAQKQLVKKSFSLAAWFAELWKAILGLFKRRKVSVVSAAQEKSHKEEMPEKVEKISVIEKEAKAPSFVLPPVPPPPKPESKEEKPEAVSSMVHDKKEKETEKEEQRKGEIPVPLPPVAEGTKDQSFRLTRSGEEQMKLTQPKDTIKRPLDMDWEVNLIPEEALEKEISLSKILYLAMSLIIACALVFGGWLWANYYYNTISITINEINSKVVIKNAEIGQYQQLQKDVSTLRQKIGNVQGLLDKHVYWSEIFNKLEEYTVSGVYFKSMTADINGSVALLAVGKDYETAVRQLFVFNEASDFVTDITISNIAFIQESAAPVITPSSEETIAPEINGEESVTFTVNLSILPSIFYYPK